MIIITQDRDKFAWLGLGRGPMAKKGEGLFIRQIRYFSVQKFRL